MTAKSPLMRKTGGARSSPVEVAETIPLRYGDDPYVWACWLYYEDGMTQGDIAQTMGISRATVNAYLADARERGIVNISIDPARLSSLTIAQQLKQHFGLQDCLVIPSDDSRPLIDRLGNAGAQALQKLLKSGDTVGITWGRTTLAVAENLALPDLQDVTIVQATGGTTTDFAYTPELCAARLAAAVNGRCVNITAPALVSSPHVRDILMAEPIVIDQFAALARTNKIIFGIASMRPNSTVHTSGFFESVSLQQYLSHNATGVIAGRFIDEHGAPVAGPLENRTIAIDLDMLRNVPMRIAVAGGFDKVPAILAALRGGYVSVLVTDAATGRGILKAEGVSEVDQKLLARTRLEPPPAHAPRTHIKKFINDPADVVDEMLEGAISAHRQYIRPVEGSKRALIARDGPRPGKVGLVIGGGTGHEPCFLGYVGKGIADAVAIGNIFSSPPPDPIVRCTEAASGGSGVLYVYGNYAGDVMNFEMAAEIAKERGIEVRSVMTTDDIASSPLEDREGRRGVAGNVFVFKIAGAACDRMWSLEECERVARKANARTFTIGVALEPCSLPQTRRQNFEIGAEEMEIGMGIHGEPGVMRERLLSADAVTDAVIDRIFAEMQAKAGDRVAVLVNSLGSTPLMELYILHRRVAQRLTARGISMHASWTGHYCTSIDMTGASITILHLDPELTELLEHPCDTAVMRIN